MQETRNPYRERANHELCSVCGSSARPRDAARSEGSSAKGGAIVTVAVGTLLSLSLRRFGQVTGGNATDGWQTWLIGNWNEQSSAGLVLSDGFASDHAITSPATPPSPFTGFGQRVLWAPDLGEFLYATPTQPQAPRLATVLFWASGGLLETVTAVIVPDDGEAIVFASAGELTPID
jgi:hypothetical protein